MLSQVPEPQWSQLSEFIADRMGLHFPPERWNDLKRGFAGAAHQFGFADPALCIDWLLSVPPDEKQLQVLASHLTIGETYFFRDPQTLAALAENILPELIRTRRDRGQRLRIWSAACCSGEEPYSLAILLHQLLPDIRDWHVTITATDINPCFLQKAMAGIYGEWSFRNAPAWLKQRYFKRTDDGRYAIVPQIRKLVNFAQLNLAQDVYPSLATGTNAMDIIFCRNVLMYFTQPQARKVIGNLAHALVDGGWLAVSPSEASRALFPQFINVNFPGAILFRKNDAPPAIEATPMLLAAVPELPIPAIEESLPWAPSTAPAADREGPQEQEPVVEQAPHTTLAFAQSLYHEGRYAESADMLLAAFAGHPPGPAAFSLLTRALANQGKLADALVWCERWIASDKLDAAGHYLHALVLLEQGDSRNARMALQRAVYLDHDFVMAHFALGNLARSRGNLAQANKHFANAQHFLGHYRHDDLLPEADGLSAGRLAQTLAAMTDAENMR